MTDTTKLPLPDVVEVISHANIMAEGKAYLGDLMRPTQPDIDEVLTLETEPLVMGLRNFSYREMLYRNRVNHAARAHLQPLASGTDLDWLAGDFGVTRLDGEADERLRNRLALRIAALAGQGTREHYEFTALAASNQVRQAQASSPTPGRVLVMLWVWDQAQAQVVRELVETALNAEGARMLGVPVTVAVAAPLAINITATIVRKRNAPASLMTMLADRLRAAFADMDVMSEGVARSYITSLLQVDGVHAVDFPDNTRPAANTTIAVGQYPALGEVELIDAGVV